MDQPRVIHFLHPQTGNFIGTLDNRGTKLFRDDEHLHDLDGTNTYNFFMPNDVDFAKKVEERTRLLIPHEETGWQEFVVFLIDDETLEGWREIRTIGAEQDLDRLKIIEPTVNASLTARQYVDLCVTGITGWQVGDVAFAGTGTISRDRPRGAFTFLKMVATRFDLELRFRTETNGGRVTGRYVDLVERIGSDRAKTVTFGEDLVAFRKIVDAGDVVTALYCMSPEREDGTRLYTTVTHEDAFQQWNWQGEHLWDVYEPDSDNQEMTVEELAQYGQTELNKRVAALYEYDVQAVSLENIYPNRKTRLGDRLNVKNTDVKPAIYAEARAKQIIRSISDPSSTRYLIGEINEIREDEVKRTFEALQRLYGVKMIKSETAPDGRPKTLWIDKSTPLNVPHTFNAATNLWEKSAPTSAEEIGGLLVGKQYNGVSITPEDGVVVERTDGLVENVMNATEGSFIQSRPSTAEPFKKVFYADEFGNLTYGGILQGSTIYLGGEDNVNGLLVLYDSTGEPVGQLDGDQRGFDKLFVGDLQAPNVVSYGDFTGSPLDIYVASEPVNGVEPDDNNENPSSWASPLRTIGEALRRIPRYFRGDVRILLAYGNTFNESITINGYMGGGTLTITNTAGHNPITGNVNISRNLVKVTLERFRLNCTGSYGAIQVTESSVLILNSYINGASGGTDFGIVALGGSSVEVRDSQINNVRIAGRASYGGTLVAVDCTGSVSDYAWQAYDGGIATGYGNAPTGGIGNTLNLRGILTGSWDFPAPPTPPTPTPVTATKTWSAESSSATWRDDFSRWDLSSGQNYFGKVAQGSWGGYGPFTGAWFFPSDLWTTLSGKTIKQIRIYIARGSGGVNASQTAVIRPHTYSARPAGKPTLGALSVNSGIAVGQGKWITLPSSFHAGFASGSSKGFGVNGGQYMVFSQSAKIEVTYE